MGTNNLIHTNNSSRTSNVIDVVDLDDDDDTPSAPAPAPLRPNQVLIPTGQVRIVPNTQAVTYAVVSNVSTATTMSGPAGMNRVLIARPQQSGQVLVTRNGMGPVVTRPLQVTKLSKLFFTSCHLTTRHLQFFELIANKIFIDVSVSIECVEANACSGPSSTVCWPTASYCPTLAASGTSARCFPSTPKPYVEANASEA